MTGGEVERITDPATIRNIDWSDHYETTTPRGATPMFDAAQDLSEREADANALEAYRVMVAELEGAADRAEAAERRADQAEARVNQLIDSLTLRTEALNRTGASNDKMRATIERVRALMHPERGMGLAASGDGRRWFDEADILEALGES